MNIHEDQKAALSALLDGELSDAERAEVLAHLDECEECRVYYAELCAIHSAMGDLGEIEPPDHFAGGVLERLHAGAAPKKRAAAVWRGWAALAACAAVVVLAVTVLPNALGGRKTNAGLAAPAAPAAAGSTLMTSLEAASESEADAAGGEADAAADEAAVNSIEESLMVMQSAPTSSPGAERKAERREADLLLYGESAEFWLWNNCELDEEQEGYWVYRGTLEELPDGLTLGTPEMVERWNKSGRDFAFVRSAEAEGVK